MAKIKPLKENPLFKDFSDKEIALLAKYVEEKTMEAPSPLFLENMKGESMYLVVKGRVRLSKMLSEGMEKTLTTLGPGDYFGEMALVEEGPRAVSAFIVESAQILTLKRADFEKLMQEAPEVAVKVVIGIHKLLSDKVRSLSPKLQEMILSESP